jgi:hypothetical protein
MCFIVHVYTTHIHLRKLLIHLQGINALLFTFASSQNDIFWELIVIISSLQADSAIVLQNVIDTPTNSNNN